MTVLYAKLFFIQRMFLLSLFSDVTFYVWVLAVPCLRMFIEMLNAFEIFLLPLNISFFLHFYDILIFTKHVYILWGQPTRWIFGVQVEEK